MHEVLLQLEVAGYLNYFSWVEEKGDRSIEAWAVKSLISDLRRDTRFIETRFYGMHKNIGKHLTDFRGIRKSFGGGSLQICVDRVTDRAYADIDGWAPIDLYGAVMHMTRDVLLPKMKGWLS